MFDAIDGPQSLSKPVEGVSELFRAFIREKSFPCVGARSALARHHMHIMEAGDIRCPRDDAAIFDRLAGFAADFAASPDLFQSFVVIFATGDALSEEAFEQALWARIQALHDLDVARGYAYDRRVGSDPARSDFSLSFAGEAFYLVGLHPGASRPARRFSAPAVVFNAHDQFQQLRADGRYETLRASIIGRDIALAGAPNPMLSRFGDTSEAAQYSGRHVGSDWQCPFRAR
ncbi:guanitoxin biosynthesis heme-dependent pre-guanitoxin N-hydroxylase GntA [Asticcacaulis sp. EMRT-3]|uniref:guanitoxin biosynthesis heme-dependent pre-guanitoxin N-hydroxylase GntA n=1 Tax=Asticcacaulis sp. EMRT-3 TaxID=3040349 RepID=UPI0024AEA9C0|nr:guanitoxin biosynthesis heme-dependent pre-guanitoxin N-hydroxylase GntA [Asticcacaulis sp. EMRT-3]MDI7775105.1 guanitoxin biosynthesis heme-dependent pre-guanitoxin N-hydroxylase GntA [Asticcacaulis sp. EMRT-3]